jgi:hypothetical protein
LALSLSIDFYILIFSSETIGFIGTNLDRNVTCVVLNIVYEFISFGNPTWVLGTNYG